MNGEKHTVEICAEPTEDEAEQIEYIREPGHHEVHVTGWDYLDHDGERDVVFDVADDAGRRNALRFGLNELELASGELTNFLSTVLQRQLFLPMGMKMPFFLQTLFNHVVHRRIGVDVVETSRGKKLVLGWEALPPK